jgi:hypothetical protein
MRIAIGCFSAITAMTSCAHPQSASLSPPQPASVVLPARAAAPPHRPPAQDVGPQLISMHVLAGNIEPIQSDDPTLPDRVLMASHGRTLEGAYKLCIASDGSVRSVTPVVHIEGADACIMDTLKGWRFPKLPTTICKVQTLRIEIP